MKEKRALIFQYVAYIKGSASSLHKIKIKKVEKKTNIYIASQNVIYYISFYLYNLRVGILNPVDFEEFGVKVVD